MTFEIGLVLGILALAVLFFVTEWLRLDLVALLVLVSLSLTGLVTTNQAFSGFSNPAVITFWAVFILSGGLTRTGVANAMGRQIMRLAGQGRVKLQLAIMLSAGVMSGFMNNVGATALLLPVVMDISRRTRQPASKLLIPLAYASLLGGLTTLIGTPPNILVSDALRASGLTPFTMFDYTPIGVIVMLAGIGFMLLVGQRLLPERDAAGSLSQAEDADLEAIYQFGERLFVIQVPATSSLAGQTLASSRLGAAVGLNVIGIIRDGNPQLAPEANTALRAGDRLIVIGGLDRLLELQGQQQLFVEEDSFVAQRLISGEVGVAEVILGAASPLVGRSLAAASFRDQYGVNVLAILRDGAPRRTNLQAVQLKPDDTLLVQGSADSLENLRDSAEFESFSMPSEAAIGDVYQLNERLIAVNVSHDSALAGQTLAESRLGDAYGLSVLGIVRDGSTHLIPGPDDKLLGGDTLLVEGKPEDLVALRGLQDLEVETGASTDLHLLESDETGLAEAVLSPRTTLAGKTLRQLHFREKYGLSVLAILREGQTFRVNLRDMPLRFGDALLLFGPRPRLNVLGREPDFLVLTESAQEPIRARKAPLAILIMLGVLMPVIFGWLPISVAAVAGASAMVLTGCLTMEEAYRFIEWRAVFLIAGMLPLGIAMEQTGAARYLADGVVTAVGPIGPLAVVAAFFILAALASQVMPNAAVAVLLAPIALSSAENLGISPYPLMMTVALSASAAFLSPVGHPANMLVMGPGGYRFSDYLRVGLPLTLTVLGVVLLALPLFWPFYP